VVRITIAFILKINDDIILATESASSLINNDPKTGQMLVYNVYDNADKMFNLCKKLPVGAVAWGLGSKGDIPVERLVRDFKSEISEKFDNGDYSVEDCVSAFKKFIFGDTYEEVFKKLSDPNAFLGFFITGYSIKSSLKSMYPEKWKLEIVSGTCVRPVNCCPKSGTGISGSGQPNPIIRIYSGFDPVLLELLKEINSDGEKIKAITEKIQEKFNMNFGKPSMSVKDLVSLSEFLVDLTEKILNYTTVVKTVGKPKEIAGINRRYGFRLIERSHYFLREMSA
jgi:hypothetical protein